VESSIGLYDYKPKVLYQFGRYFFLIVLSKRPIKQLDKSKTYHQGKKMVYETQVKVFVGMKATHLVDVNSDGKGENDIKALIAKMIMDGKSSELKVREPRAERVEVLDYNAFDLKEFGRQAKTVRGFVKARKENTIEGVQVTPPKPEKTVAKR